MHRTRFHEMQCPIARSLEAIGEWWSLLILREALLGARRFQDFEQRLGIPPTTLSRRLKALCKHELLVRQRYEERPPRDEYELTAKGTDLMPVLLSLATWGNRWLAPEGLSILPVEASTGRPLEPVLVDRRTRRELKVGRVALKAGPVASMPLRQALTPPRLFGEASVPARGAGVT